MTHYYRHVTKPTFISYVQYRDYILIENEIFNLAIDEALKLGVTPIKILTNYHIQDGLEETLTIQLSVNSVITFYNDYIEYYKDRKTILIPYEQYTSLADLL